MKYKIENKDNMDILLYQISVIYSHLELNKLNSNDQRHIVILKIYEQIKTYSISITKGEFFIFFNLCMDFLIKYPDLYYKYDKIDQLLNHFEIQYNQECIEGKYKYEGWTDTDQEIIWC